MSQDGHERESDEAAERISDERLRTLLGSHVVPEPSKDFVSDLLLRIQLEQNRTPEPSHGFVDRVMDAWSQERAGAHRTVARRPAASNTEELVPVVDFSRHAVAEVTASDSFSAVASKHGLVSGLPVVLGIVGFAAALLLAFFVGRQSVASSEFTDQALVRIEDFPSRGSNRFARSLSLVVDRVDSRLSERRLSEQGSTEQGKPAYPRPILSLPAPPANLIRSAVIEIHIDKATLESLGVAREQL